MPNNTIATRHHNKIHLINNETHEVVTDKIIESEITEIPLNIVKIANHALIAAGYPYHKGYSVPFKFFTLASAYKVLLGPFNDVTTGLSTLPDSSLQHNIGRMSKYQ